MQIIHGADSRLLRVRIVNSPEDSIMAKRLSLVGLASLSAIMLTLLFNPVSARDGQDEHVAARRRTALQHATTQTVLAGILGRTIQLEFGLGDEEENPKFPVLTTGGAYRIQRDVGEAGNEHLLRFSGVVAPFEEKGRLLVTFETQMNHYNANDDETGTFDLEGSVIIKAGETMTLGVLGGETVTLTATTVD
jgi:hypothetical protein